MRGESRKARNVRNQTNRLSKTRAKAIVICALAAFAAIGLTFLKVYLELNGWIPAENIEMVNTGLHVASLALCFVAGPAFMAYLKTNKQIQALELQNSKKKKKNRS